jgi:hypothetical protein
VRYRCSAVEGPIYSHGPDRQLLQFIEPEPMELDATTCTTVEEVQDPNTDC